MKMLDGIEEMSQLCITVIMSCALPYLVEAPFRTDRSVESFIRSFISVMRCYTVEELCNIPLFGDSMKSKHALINGNVFLAP